MTTTLTTTGHRTDLTGLATADACERSQRTLMSERDHAALQRLAAMPPWAVLLLEELWILTLAAAGVLEQPLVATALARVLPTAPDWQVQTEAVS
jgi:hypothetical protein